MKEAYELLENTFDQLCKNCYWLSYAEDQKKLSTVFDGWKDSFTGSVLYDLFYKISFKKASNFEQPLVVDAISKLIIATYDYRTKLIDYS